RSARRHAARRHGGDVERELAVANLRARTGGERELARRTARVRQGIDAMRRALALDVTVHAGQEAQRDAAFVATHELEAVAEAGARHGRAGVGTLAEHVVAARSLVASHHADAERHEARERERDAEAADTVARGRGRGTTRVCGRTHLGLVARPVLSDLAG